MSKSTARLGGSSREAGHVVTGHDLAAVRDDIRSHGVDDALASADGDRPAARVRVGGQNESRGRRGRPGQWLDGVAEHPGQQRGGDITAEAQVPERAALLEHAQSESCERDRMPWHPQQRRGRELRDGIRVLREGSEELLPCAPVCAEAVGCAVEGAPGESGLPVVERMRVGQLRIDEVESLGQPEPLEELGCEGHRVHGGADVVPEPGQGQL